MHSRLHLLASLIVLAVGLVGMRAHAQCEVDQLTASDMADADQFGDAVAISGDLAVVGASRDDDLGASSGAAYVFRHESGTEGEGGSWVTEFIGIDRDIENKLLASDGAANDLFGWSVAIDAFAPDGAVIVVGAYLDDHSMSNAGAAYVFRDTGTGWVQQAKLVASDAAQGDEFGESVAVSGDFIVIGAARADDPTAGSNAGAAYVFRFNGVQWTQQAKLTAPTPVSEDRFGSSVAIDGETIFVGAPLNDPDALANAGAVWAFTYNGTDWTDPPQMLIAMDAQPGDRFGESVDVAGNLAIVGAHLEDEIESGEGAAYVFARKSIWLQEAKLKANDPNGEDQFGQSVSIVEDAERGDLAIVGAALDDDAGSASGSAYLFRYLGVWDQQAKVTAGDGAPNDQFGIAVALTSEFLLVGASKDDITGVGTNVGSAYLFTSEVADCEDCDDNGVTDFVEIGSDPSLDCNDNGVLDLCEIDVESDAEGGPFFCEEDCATDCNDNGVPDECDISSGASQDDDFDGVPDECQDCNGNGVADAIDISKGTSSDCNGNEIPDECDLDAGDLEDCDANGIPDVCEIDSLSAAPGGPFFCTQDCDPDCNDNGIPDACDIESELENDCNENGIPDSCDIASGTAADVNRNGVPDACEDCNDNGIADFIEIDFLGAPDCNNNDVIDSCEIDPADGAPGGPFYCVEDCDPDCNNNGVPDACDIAERTSLDVNRNGIPDECEDCNGNGVIDTTDISTGTSSDCNGNDIPDECEIAIGTKGGEYFCINDCDPDCNGNGVPDACDVEAGTSPDCDGNGVPDECDPDCNDNGVPDACDVDPTDPDGDGHVSPDFDHDGLPDECEPDCDDDGIPDFIEILSGLQQDLDGDGIPDDCEEPDPGIPGDITGDELVNFADLLALLDAWGACPDDPEPCPADFNESGGVDFADLLVVLDNWD